MKKTKRLFALLIAMATVVSLLAAIPLTASAAVPPRNAVPYYVSEMAQLQDALRNTTQDINIYLQQNIIYNAQIQIGNTPGFVYGIVDKRYDGYEIYDGLSVPLDACRRVTIYLEGRTLTIKTLGQDGIVLSNGAQLIINGPGTLNIDSNGNGINVSGAANRNTFIPTNRNHTSTVYKPWSGTPQDVVIDLTAQSKADNIPIFIPISGTDTYIPSSFIRNGGSTINVSVNGTGNTAAFAQSHGNRVEISSAIASGINSVCVRAINGGIVTVAGDVWASGTGSFGARVENGGRADITGIITAMGTDSRGAYARSAGSRIDTRGYISASGNYSRAAHAVESGVVYTSGRVFATSANSIGAEASDGGEVWVEETISGEGKDIVADGRTISFGSPTSRRVGVGSSRYYWNEFRNGNGKVYSRTEGIGSGWRQSGSNWYYYDNNEIVKNKWIQDGAWYYLHGDGRMAKNQQVSIKGTTYQFRNDGAMITGWAQVGRTWYYYKPSGAMAKNEWVQDGGTWYWLKSSGAMAANETLRINGTMHRFLASGAWVDPNAGSGGSSGANTAGSWLREGNRWYFIKPGNVRAANEWVLDGGTWYWLKTGGVMAANETLRINGKSYSFNASGACTNPY